MSGLRPDETGPRAGTGEGTSGTGAATQRSDQAQGERTAAAAEGQTVASSDERFAQMESELATVQDRLMRALADQENVRRRAQRDRDEALRYANADLARDLLPILDNLTRALDSLPEEDVADESVTRLLRGVAAIERQMVQVLERHGIQRFDPLGEPFDPHHHQAVYQHAVPDRPEGTVAEVLQPGYRHHDRLLRPAMVGVAGEEQAQSSPPAPDQAPTQERRH